MVFNTDEAAMLEVEARNLRGRVSVTLWRKKKPPKDPTNPETGASLSLQWWGTIPGEPSVWSETWYWKEEPPSDFERLVPRCPDRALLEKALAAPNAKIPEDF